jgi:hypothetical protein
LARGAAPITFESETVMDPDSDAAEFQRHADRVASMIVTSTYSDLECALAERELRMECLSLLAGPDGAVTTWCTRPASGVLREQFR